jgi:hypothetical protein
VTERLIALAVQPWRCWSLAGFLWFALPQLAWEQVTEK